MVTWGLTLKNTQFHRCSKSVDTFYSTNFIWQKQNKHTQQVYFSDNELFQKKTNTTWQRILAINKQCKLWTKLTHSALQLSTCAWLFTVEKHSQMKKKKTLRIHNKLWLSSLKKQTKRFNCTQHLLLKKDAVMNRWNNRCIVWLYGSQDAKVSSKYSCQTHFKFQFVETLNV